jgi:hypothetical protein
MFVVQTFTKTGKLIQEVATWEAAASLSRQHMAKGALASEFFLKA